ncbi:tight adherance operon protein [Yersinia pseudotuberculosis]|uniref:type II secretion system F family protein n=1 Tax=Yersinia pseudotuberculosis TaxID=633 RepID=UPI0038B6909B
MIYYVVALSGILLLVLNNLKWMKIKRSISNTKKSKAKSTSSITILIKKIFFEWIDYVSTHSKSTPHILLPICSLVIVYYINSTWINVNYSFVFIINIIFIIVLQLKYARSKHYLLFKQDFPEVLLMINMAASSGASINQVLERCGKEIRGPLGQELGLICRRLNLGETPETVFYDAYERFHYPEFYFLVTIILLNIQQGGQLKELIARLSQIITKKKTTEQKKAVMTAQIRMSVNIISIMPILFSFLLYLLDPTTIEFVWQHPTGRFIIYYIIISEVIGIFIIRKMLGKSL